MSLTETFAALGDPTRLAIVERLAEGDATVKELAEPFSVSLPAISRHLKVLEHAGLITRGRTAQSRPSSLRVEAFKEATMWMNARREMWEGRMTDSTATCSRSRRDPTMSDMQTAQDQTVLITRIFDAPCGLVFQAWTDPTTWRSGLAPRDRHAARDGHDRSAGRRPLRARHGPEAIRCAVPRALRDHRVDPPRLLVLKSGPMPEVGMHEPTVTRIELHDHGEKTRMSLSRRPVHAVPPHARRVGTGGVRQARRAARR